MYTPDELREMRAAGIDTSDFGGSDHLGEGDDVYEHLRVDHAAPKLWMIDDGDEDALVALHREAHGELIVEPVPPADWKDKS
jgi:hypothetical protein